VRLASKPRMADFASWVVAAEPALPWQPGAFLSAYTANRGATNALALESSIIAPPILSLMARQQLWHGTAMELLAELETHHTDDKMRKRKEWPTSPRKLSGELRRIAPNLRRGGVVVTFGTHTRRGTPITIEQVGKTPSPSSPPSPGNPPKDLRSDEGVTIGARGDGVGDEGNGRPAAPSRHNPFPDNVGDDGDGGDRVFHTQSCPAQDTWGEI
jgi:hypothetical protein